VGAGVGAVVGTVVGAVVGTNVGTGVGAVVGAGVGAGVETDVEIGAGAGVGSGGDGTGGVHPEEHLPQVFWQSSKEFSYSEHQLPTAPIKAAQLVYFTLLNSKFTVLILS